MRCTPLPPTPPTHTQDTGILTPKNVTHIDWSKYGGIWTPCAGSTSPWGTHLGGE